MSSIAFVFAQHLSQAAGFQLGLDGRMIWQGDTVLQVNVKDGMIPTQSHYDILAEIADRVPERAALSIKYAKMLNIDQMGTLGLACKAAPTLGATVQRLTRYYNLLSTSMRYRVADTDTGVLVWQDVMEGGGRGIVLTPEAGLTVVLHLLRQIAAAPIDPVAVLFQHQPPKDAEVFASFYGCTPTFGAEKNGIVFARKTMDCPNLIGDAALSAFLVQHLDAESAARRLEETFADLVLSRIRTSLSDGAPVAADMASDLGMSERTFHRRLADEKKTYRALVEQTRKALAENLLREKTRPLAEIAFLTGFSEQSAFSRAFKRWVGQTPAEYRGQFAI
ncbi:MAG: AraC family transcriptional regulator ligand-binding domain-containing protein [Pseudomonadota bacterium]